MTKFVAVVVQSHPTSYVHALPIPSEPKEGRGRGPSTGLRGRTACGLLGGTTRTFRLVPLGSGAMIRVWPGNRTPGETSVVYGREFTPNLSRACQRCSRLT